MAQLYDYTIVCKFIDFQLFPSGYKSSFINFILFVNTRAYYSDCIESIKNTH